MPAHGRQPTPVKLRFSGLVEGQRHGQPSPTGSAAPTCAPCPPKPSSMPTTRSAAPRSTT